MFKKDELTNPASCLNKAGPRERVFVLRENDPLFSQAVRHWATMAEGIHEDDKIAEARELADAAERARADRDKPQAAPAVPAAPQCNCATTTGVHAPWCNLYLLPDPAPTL